MKYKDKRSLKLRATRLSEGLTQADVAKRLGMKKHTYGRKEREPRLFDFDELLKLKKLFKKKYIEDIFF